MKAKEADQLVVIEEKNKLIQNEVRKAQLSQQKMERKIMAYQRIQKMQEQKQIRDRAWSENKLCREKPLFKKIEERFERD